MSEHGAWQQGSGASLHSENILQLETCQQPRQQHQLCVPNNADMAFADVTFSDES